MNVKSETSILDEYVERPPARENAISIFAGEWSSNIPGFGQGHANLFDDDRIHWMGKRCGGFAGKRILELGPLEAAHTYMMANAGARVTAIEANTRAFLKCLVVKNVLNFDADIQLGDFRPHLANSQEQYDVIVSCGVLYHMTDPLKLLQDMAKRAPAIGIWTHYYDPDIINDRQDLRDKFCSDARICNIGSQKITMYQQSYLKALEWSGFCGGSHPISFWLTRDSLLGALNEHGEIGRAHV